jgi:hypothetical protein
MSNEIAIRVNNLSKLYHLGEHAGRLRRDRRL